MPFNDAYHAQVELLIRCLPALTPIRDFALKGGTAINLFHDNMPRLSVDIDLTYLPVSDRDTALASINSRLGDFTAALESTIPNVQVQSIGTPTAPRLLVNLDSAHIKIEPSPVMRGTLFSPVELDLCERARHEFEATVTTRCLDARDLYAGKFCAALDRQHPRDLYDVSRFMERQNLDTVREACVVYLACHRRPISELIAPNNKPIEDLYHQHFAGMSDPAVSLEALYETRRTLFQWIANALNDAEREFLISVKRGQPDWSLLPIKNIDQLPALQWKLHNIQRMDKRRHKLALERLTGILNQNRL